MDNIKIDEHLDDFYTVCEIFDNNLYILAFHLKHYCLQDMKPSTILKHLENQNFEHIIDALDETLDMSILEIKKFKSIFKRISYLDEYNAYKGYYEMYQQKQKEIDVLKKQVEADKTKIKNLENYLKKGSLFI